MNQPHTIQNMGMLGLKVFFSIVVRSGRCLMSWVIVTIRFTFLLMYMNVCCCMYVVVSLFSCSTCTVGSFVWMCVLVVLSFFYRFAKKVIVYQEDGSLGKLSFDFYFPVKGNELVVP